MMEIKRMRIEIRVAWWFWIYQELLLTVAWIAGCEPDYEKLVAVWSKAVKMRVVISD